MDTAVSLASTILKDLLDQKADEARDFSGVIREFFAVSEMITVFTF